MTTVLTSTAYHSISPDDPLEYHDRPDCPQGRRIPPQHWAPGAIGPRCETCSHLAGETTTQA
jgi:hypothetical protein